MRLWLDALRLAITQLARNASRTALTSLGVLIGVAAVIAMVGLGQGATAAIEQDLSSLGVNLLFVEAGVRRGPRASLPAEPLDLADADAIGRQVRHVEAVAPVVAAEAQAAFGGRTWDTGLQGTTAAWLGVLGRELAAGRVFTDAEDRGGAPVCVLGPTVVEEVLGTADPLGAELRLGALTCTVIGVLTPEGENTFGMDQDDLVLLPIRAVQRRVVGSTAVSQILVSADDPEHMSAVARDVDALMRQRRHVTSDSAVDFSVRDTRELAEMLGSITTVLTTFLAAVAGVSLLVGGIGIMNIMLVSVTERTREIGIRLAVGALPSDVRLQFLVEAAVLAVFGGVLGVIVGIGGTAIGATVLEVPVVVDPRIVLLSVGFSAMVGVVFGWWPASRAARMEPMEALRHL
ncbi:MAG: ABC transporter permease [Alphaproteobacteria bacterium]|nr:ABC transporter permease [Alphaproteobacteria bacterium]